MATEVVVVAAVVAVADAVDAAVAGAVVVAVDAADVVADDVVVAVVIVFLFPSLKILTGNRSTCPKYSTAPCLTAQFAGKLRHPCEVAGQEAAAISRQARPSGDPGRPTPLKAPHLMIIG